MASSKAISIILNLKDKFTEPIKKVTENTKKFQREVKNAENKVKASFKKMGDDVKAQTKKIATNIGDAISKVTKLGAVVGTALVTKGLVDVVSVGKEFEQSMANVSATIGINKSNAEGLKQYEALENKARSVAAVSKFTAGEVADAMNYMAMAGWKSEQMLGSGLDKILQLAGASNTAVATTSDIVTDALTAFSMKAEDAGQFADIMAATCSNANTNVSMMGETFSYAAPVAGALGHTAADTALAIGLMGNSGIKASSAGTALRTMMTSLQGTVELSGDKLGKWIIETENADGSMRDFRDVILQLREAFSNMTESEKAANAEALAGKTGMSGLLAIVNAAESDFNKLAAAIDNSEGATAKMEETMLDTVEGSMSIMKSTLDELKLRVWDKIKTPLKNLIQACTKSLPKAFDKASAGISKFKQIVHKVVNEVRYMWGTMVEKIKGKVGEHDTALNAMKLGYAKMKNIISFFGDVTQAAWSKMEPTVQWLMSTAIPKLTELFLILTEKAYSLYTTIKDNWSWIVPIVSGIVGAMVTYKAIMIGSAIVTKVHTAALLLGKGVILAVAMAQNLLNAAFVASPIGWVVLGMGALVAAGVALIMNWDKVCSAARKVGDIIKNTVGGAITWVSDKIKGAIDLFNKLFSVGDKAKNLPSGNTVNIRQAVPEFATGTSYHRGGLARINEGGRGEVVNLPNGSQVIPHDVATKQAAAQNINVSLAVNGNVYGEQDLIERVGGAIASRVKLAITNI